MLPGSILQYGQDRYNCRWMISHKSTNNNQHPYWYSLDVTVQKLHPGLRDDIAIDGVVEGSDKSLYSNGTVSNHRSDLLQNSSVHSLGLNSAGEQFMLELLSAATLAPACRSRAAKLIIPRNGGYIVRSDIVPLRISSAPRVIYTCSLADPQQWFPGVRETDIDLSHLSKVFQVAAGGVIIDAGQSAYDVAADLDAFEVEVRNRLSFPWLLKERRSRQTLVFVGNYLRYPGHGGTGANHYTFARALGIDLVVLDAHGCWLEDPYYAEFRKAFLPCDLSRNDELCDRIIDTLSQYKERIDGIVTFHESLQVGVAKAAELLGLLTLPPAALGIAADKYETGIFAGHASYLATSAKEALEINKEKRLRFPLILKPCRGWGSEGVYKTENALEFAEAAVAIEAHAKLHGPRFVIEEYCDGPEVDVNMVLSNSELLFAEINDDLPNRSNGNIKGAVQEFLETGQVYPSNLPSSELNMLVRDMHQTLLRIGLPSGVFHLEARIKDSGMIYGVRDGILDLEERQPIHPIKSPKTWVLEINARPPGIGASDPAEITYGIDYVGLGLLFALGDQELIEALSHPFLQGPQYWCQPVLIPVDKGGVFDSDDICNELLQRRPELAQYVSRSVCYWKKGDAVPSTMFSAWVAHFIVFSRVSRRHLLEICETIRKEVRYSIV